MLLSFSDESIEELRKAAEAEFGVPCTTEDAREMANSLSRLVELLSQARHSS